MDLTEARQLAFRAIAALESERVPIEEALGRVIAQKIVADRHLPGQRRSRFDGFALRNADTHEAAPDIPVSLRIVSGCIAAGHPTVLPIQPGECIRILTGAPLPEFADAVAPQEDVVTEGRRLVLGRSYGPGNGVTLPGEDVRKGELVLSDGEVLTPSRLALMVALGYQNALVYRHPQVALLATGDEVRALGDGEEGPFTYCNNLYLLTWLTRLQGATPHVLGVVGDEPRIIADKLKSTGTDIVITTGGMGRGDRDFILEAWRLIGVQTLFSGINLTPGKSTALGVRGGQVFFGLPGNPWAAQIVFEELIAPVLKKWQGLRGPGIPRVAAVLKEPVKHKPGFYSAIRGALDLELTPPCFVPSEAKSASVFSRIRDSFAYILLEPHVVEVDGGSKVQVHLIGLPMLASPLLCEVCSLQ